MTSIPPVARKLLLALLTPLAFLLTLELALRLAPFEFRWETPPLLMWNPHEDRQMDEGKSLFIRDASQLWVPRPGAEVEWGDDERINRFGWRGPRLAVERAEGSVRVATLGDSSTFGLFVPYAESYSGRLETLLEEQGRAAEVMDCGVVGYTVRQGIERYRTLVRRFRPDVVVAAFGAVNEHYTAIGGLPDEQKIARSKRAARLESGATGWVLRRARVMQLVEYLRYLNRGGKAGIRRAEALAQRREAELTESAGEVGWEGTRRVSPEQFGVAIAELARAVRADGARLVVVAMPRVPEAEVRRPVLRRYTEVLEQVAAEEGIQLLDARGLFRAEFEAGTPPGALFAGDWWHPNAPGHDRIARGLATLVLEPERARVGPGS